MAGMASHPAGLTADKPLYMGEKGEFLRKVLTVSTWAMSKKDI